MSLLLIHLLDIQICVCSSVHHITQTKVNNKNNEKYSFSNQLPHQNKLKLNRYKSNNITDTHIYNVLYPNSTLQIGYNHEYSYGECLNNYNCFLPYGICLNITTCMCMPDYADIFIQGHSVKDLSCSYKRKKILVAAMLEFFLPLGLGHFYVGHNTLGTIKFSYNFILYVFCCTLYIKGTRFEAFNGMLLLCIILSCAIPIWNIIDLFLFFTDEYKDGYGVALI